MPYEWFLILGNLELFYHWSLDFGNIRNICWFSCSKDMNSKAWKWILGLIYIVVVAAIWVAASLVVQSVVDAGVSPFLITYICNSLFVVYIPIVKIGRYVENSHGGLWFWRSIKSSHLEVLGRSKQVILLGDNDANNNACASLLVDKINIISQRDGGYELLLSDSVKCRLPDQFNVIKDVNDQLDAKGRWTGCVAAKSNTILSSVSSLFTFMVSLAFLGEKFTWVKLFSILLCMGGMVIVSFGDSQRGLNAIASNPLLGDILALVSAGLYAVYISLIRKKFPDDDGKIGHASMAQLFGYLGLFNMFLFLPVALVLNFTKVEPFYTHTWKQLGLVVGKGLLDSMLGDYLWAEAVLLTSTTVATAGIAIQVPLAAIADIFTGNAPGLLDCLGAVAVMIGFAGINIPSGAFGKPSREDSLELEDENISSSNEDHTLPRSQVSAAIS